jgi:hypothetical protein
MAIACIGYRRPRIDFYERQKEQEKEQRKMKDTITNLVKATAGWFLYIFIDPNANLSSTIMRKRSMQISVLKVLSNIPTVELTYANLAKIVQDEITAKNGKTPVQLLMELYNGGAVTGIGDTSKFWTYIANGADAIYSILNFVTGTSENDIRPKPSDWDRPQTGSGSGAGTQVASFFANNISTILMVGALVGMAAFVIPKNE